MFRFTFAGAPSEPIVPITDLSGTFTSAGTGCIGVTDWNKRGGMGNQNKTWLYGKGKYNKSNACESDACTHPDFRNCAADQIDDTGGYYNWSARCYRSNFFPGMDEQQQDNLKVKCCTGEEDFINCDPDYCPTATEKCTPVFTKWCKTGDNINDELCLRLLKNDPTLFKEKLSSYCITDNKNGERLKTRACRAYCAEDVKKCRVPLDILCKDRKVDDPEWGGICNCWLDPKIYETFSTTMEEKWKVPPGVLSGPRNCTFPSCKRADEDFKPKTTCDPLSITTCVQDISVNLKGAVIGNGGSINVSQNAECATMYHLKADSDTKDGSVKDGSTKPKACVVNIDCGAGKICGADKKCADKKSTEPRKISPWIIAAIVVGTLLLIGLAVYFFLFRKKETPVTKKTTTKTSIVAKKPPIPVKSSTQSPKKQTLLPTPTKGK